MKKIFLAVMMFAVILMNGCGTDDGTIKVGAVKYLNVMEDSLDEMLSKKSSLPPGSRKHVFFENLSTMLAALMAGQIDEISVYRTVAVHLSNTNPDVDWLISEPVVSDVFCCAMREEDVELKREFDAAILQLSKDGTLSKLVKNYIDESNRNDEPPAIELPTFYGAETVRIGVTGDLPMLDYIRPDGMPAGFNTAVLAEISRIIGKNFFLVQIESGARAMALSSKEVDVIFWVVTPQNDSVLPANFDKPYGVIVTVPYFSDEIVHVGIKR